MAHNTYDSYQNNDPRRNELLTFTFKTDLKHVIIICSKSKLSLLSIFLLVKDMAICINHLKLSTQLHNSGQLIMAGLGLNSIPLLNSYLTSDLLISYIP